MGGIVKRAGGHDLAVEQRQEVKRLSQAAARLKQVTTAILLMGKSDLEVGLEELLRRGRSPGSIARHAPSGRSKTA